MKVQSINNKGQNKLNRYILLFICKCVIFYRVVNHEEESFSHYILWYCIFQILIWPTYLLFMYLFLLIFFPCGLKRKSEQWNVYQRESESSRRYFHGERQLPLKAKFSQGESARVFVDFWAILRQKHHQDH